ncbi:hypothetical protein FUAX_35790 [Fulvitalea axinellae]|uniref:Uncharacterized protein n=1 Tax=Fulvitalea axinellae TaxID=1182444 RepID=A0AAU9CVW4_9BACT|nr:hypothetical protein FUAX_35790 [Fulvitalea axinellae]
MQKEIYSLELETVLYHVDPEEEKEEEEVEEEETPATDYDGDNFEEDSEWVDRGRKHNA